MKRLEGKVAVVTGGNSGIGLASAIEFGREGAHVVISGRDPKTLQKAAEQIGGDTLAVVADNSRLSDIDKLMAAVKAKYGRIDVLFVNAGIATFGPFESFTEKQFDEMANINVKGSFFTVQKALPLLSKGSSVFFNTSAANEIGMPNTVAYSATKAAIRSFARTMSAELVARGVRVNAISPGPIQTPIFARMGMSGQQIDEMTKHMAQLVPAGRMGQMEEVAKVAAFLASSDSSFLLGAEIPVDGGIGQL
jgi:NAD(P)-dependent dehydrogenase (short-subunit alcohol dehydrogenase family)